MEKRSPIKCVYSDHDLSPFVEDAGLEGGNFDPVFLYRRIVEAASVIIKVDDLPALNGRDRRAAFMEIYKEACERLELDVEEGLKITIDSDGLLTTIQRPNLKWCPSRGFMDFPEVPFEKAFPYFEADHPTISVGRYVYHEPFTFIGEDGTLFIEKIKSLKESTIEDYVDSPKETIRKIHAMHPELFYAWSDSGTNSEAKELLLSLQLVVNCPDLRYIPYLILSHGAGKAKLIDKTLRSVFHRKKEFGLLSRFLARGEDYRSAKEFRKAFRAYYKSVSKDLAERAFAYGHKAVLDMERMTMLLNKSVESKFASQREAKRRSEEEARKINEFFKKAHAIKLGINAKKISGHASSMPNRSEDDLATLDLALRLFKSDHLEEHFGRVLAYAKSNPDIPGWRFHYAALRMRSMPRKNWNYILKVIGGCDKPSYERILRETRS